MTHLVCKERVVLEENWLFYIGLARFRKQGAFQLSSNVKNK